MWFIMSQDPRFVRYVPAVLLSVCSQAVPPNTYHADFRSVGDLYRYGHDAQDQVILKK